MIVYGDPQFQIRLGEALELIREKAVQTDWGSLDAVRTLLIWLGQLEQGVEDVAVGGLGFGLIESARQWTDSVARRLCEMWDECESSNSKLQTPGKLQPRSSNNVYFNVPLPACGNPDDWNAELTIKIPEGFEFYALYPEQYILTAQKWAEEYAAFRSGERVLVVGLRSIGTTLSAVAAARLCSLGWRAKRMTVRPGGHPYQRHVSLPKEAANGFRSGIVVDEGPGLSGSSIAATVAAMKEVGIECVSIFPGHGGMPGAVSSAPIQKVWRTIPRYVTRLDEMRWKGKTWAQLVSGRSIWQDVGAGKWRSIAYERESEWPAITARLERPKYMAVAADGIRSLYKFEGLDCLLSPGMERDKVQTSCVNPGTRHSAGFTEYNWINGKRPSRQDISTELLKRMAGHVIEAANITTTPQEIEAGISRLAAMAYANVNEALGDAFAAIIPELAKDCGPALVLPGYGDGRMAPWEWVLGSQGELAKVDCGAHDTDHTVVGQQPILWDFAGLIVEWDLNLTQREELLRFARARGLVIPMPALRFFEISYSAFRVGMMRFSVGDAENDAERARGEAACEYYCERLRSGLVTNRGAVNGREVGGHVHRVHSGSVIV